jgi:DNA topoisomerase-1
MRKMMSLATVLVESIQAFLEDNTIYAGAPSKFLPYDKEHAPAHLAGAKIMPGWKHVHYNPDPHGKLLAVGKDKNNITQPVYSEKHKENAEHAKHARVMEMDKRIPEVDKTMESHITTKHPHSESAHVLKLIRHSGIRVGSEKERHAKVKAYGATTLEGRHVVKDKDGVRLNFVGKEGVNLNIPISHPDIAKELLARKKKAGDTGKIFNTNEKHVLKYVKTHVGEHFKTKDFRTWKGTTEAHEKVKSMPVPTNPNEYKKSVNEVGKHVGGILGNTRQVALKSYISPHVFAHWKAHSGA